ncbi:hypothetical protein [Micromonospora parva]|uniref:hypothetical protein n=1 Tax=Micromonospora parva TaxID=1464048 RepID=UPI0004C0B1DF|nr:hypothetical protein [Micromonospora parva]
MVPDDIVKPPHKTVEMTQLTPQVRPAELSTEIYELIRLCATENPNNDAAEIHECLTAGRCSGKVVQGHERISLLLVLYVIADQRKTEASYRPVHGR